MIEVRNQAESILNNLAKNLVALKASEGRLNETARRSYLQDLRDQYVTTDDANVIKMIKSLLLDHNETISPIIPLHPEGLITIRREHSGCENDITSNVEDNKSNARHSNCSTLDEVDTPNSLHTYRDNSINPPQTLRCNEYEVHPEQLLPNQHLTTQGDEINVNSETSIASHMSGDGERKGSISNIDSDICKNNRIYRDNYSHIENISEDERGDDDSMSGSSTSSTGSSSSSSLISSSRSSSSADSSIMSTIS